MTTSLARVPYSRLQQQDPAVDREFQRIERMSAGLYVPKVLVSARSPYTVMGTDTMLLVDATAGAVTLTFPLAARVDGLCVQIVKADSSANAVTLTGTFSGVVNPTLTTQYQTTAIATMNGVYYMASSVVALLRVLGNLTVLGSTSLQAMTATTVHATSTSTFDNTVTVTAGGLSVTGTITMATAVSKLVPGATSFSHRNTADSADNVLITDAGAVTVRNGLTVTAGGLTVSAGTTAVQAFTATTGAFSGTGTFNAAGANIKIGSSGGTDGGIWISSSAHVMRLADFATGSAHFDLDLGSGSGTFVGSVTAGGGLDLTGTPPTAAASHVAFGGSTRTTIGANGAATALTALPLGYVDINVGGTIAQIPYYNRGA